MRLLVCYAPISIVTPFLSLVLALACCGGVIEGKNKQISLSLSLASAVCAKQMKMLTHAEQAYLDGYKKAFSGASSAGGIALSVSSACDAKGDSEPAHNQ